MAWVRIDDGFADHPKIVSAGPLAALIQVRALCYAARHLTDGFLPSAAVPGLLTGFGHLGIETGGDPELYAVGHYATDVDWPTVMVDRGLWEHRDGGYQIHDFLDYNPSRRAVLSQRRDRQRAGRIGGTVRAERAAHAQALATAHAQAGAIAGATRLLQAPSPSPLSSRDKSLSESPDGLTPESTNHHPPKLNPKILDALDHCSRLGAVPRLRTVAFWHAEVNANVGVRMPEQIYRAEAWLASHSDRVPKTPKGFVAFMHNWLRNAERPHDEEGP